MTNAKALHPHARIMVVDDDDAILATIQRILSSAGYQNVVTTSDPRKTLALFYEVDPELLILDIRMPHLDGFAVMRQLAGRSRHAHLSILAVTGETGPGIKHSALAMGASDYLPKPFEGAELVLRVNNLIRLSVLTRELKAEVESRTSALKQAELDIAERLALAAELRDYQSGEHTQRVGRTSGLVARAMGLPEDEVETIRRAAPLHDIGKIAIPDRILLKPGSLTLEELEIVKRHTTLGARMLAGSQSKILQAAEEIALYHHENWDGTGYTPGVEGDMIPLPARIVHVVDVFDALVHERPYKASWSVEAAIEVIEDGAGKSFDPDVVTAFLKVQATDGLPTLSDELGSFLHRSVWEDLSGLRATLEPDAPADGPSGESEAAARPL